MFVDASPELFSTLLILLFIGSIFGIVTCMTVLANGIWQKVEQTARLNNRSDQSIPVEECTGRHRTKEKWASILSALEQSRLFAAYLATVSRLFPGMTRGYVVSHELYDIASQNSSKRYRAAHSFSSLLIGCVFGLVSSVQGLGVALLFALVGWLLGFVTQYSVAKRKAGVYRAQCLGQLSDAIELIVLVVETGATLDQALELYAVNYDGLLALEFRNAIQAWRSGALTRDETLSRLAIRLNSDSFSRFVTTVAQAAELGVPLVSALSEQAQFAREDKKTQIETEIAKAPVRMMIPMAVCILPAMLLLLLGPIVLQVGEGFGG